MDKPKIVSPRGYSIRQIFDRAVQTYRSNLIPMLVLSAVVVIPTTLVNYAAAEWQDRTLGGMNLPTNVTATTLNQAQAASLLGQLLNVFVFTIGVNLLTTFVQLVALHGPLSVITSENYWGRPATLSQAFATVIGRIGTLLNGLLGFFFGLILLVIAMTFVLFLCGFGVGIIVFIAASVGTLLVPILILERGTAMNALTRSWALGKANIWPILGLTIGISAIGFIVGLISGLVLGRVPILDLVVSTAVGVLIAPLLPIAYTLLYYEARARMERLNISLHRVSEPSREAIPPLPPLAGRLTSEDYLNLALVTMATFVVVLLLAGASLLMSGGSNLM